MTSESETSPVHNPFRHAAWRTYTPVDGLASLYVEHAEQDREGYLWFATAHSGASRFDGEEFVTFTQRDGLPSNSLMQVLGDRQGRLWFAGWNGGACWYDGSTFHRLEELDRLDGAVSCMHEDRQGRLWFGGPRLICCLDGERVRDLLPEFTAQCGHRPGNCWGIAEDADGRLWMGTQSLVCFDGEGFRSYGGLGREQKGIDFAYAVSADQAGQVLAGGHDEIARYDDQGFHAILKQPLGHVRKIRLDRAGRAWAGTTGNGAYCFGDEQTFHIGVADGLTYPAVNDIFQSPDGLLWFCTWGGGVSCCDPQVLRLVDQSDEGSAPGTAAELQTAADGLTVFGGETGASNNIFSVQQDRAGRVWMASAVGLMRWDGGHVERVEYASGLGADLGMVADDEDNLWIRSNHWDGLLRWDGHRLEKADILPDGADITALSIDRDGRLLIGFVETEAVQIGIGRFDGRHLQVLFRQPQGCGEQRPARITEARDGICWFAVGGFDEMKSIGRLGADGSVTWIPIPGPDEGVETPQLDWLDDLLEDRRGRLWVGTRTGVLCLEDGGWRNMLRGAGPRTDNASCFCLYEDRQGDVWIGTEYGALHYDGSRFQLVSSPHIKGPVRSILQDREGHYWFATTDGTVRYTPTETRPRVRLLRVDADRTYEGIERLEVPASSGQVIFAYRGLSFRTQPRHMLYAHRLEGLEEDWLFGREQRAAYADLVPGEYTFAVKAIDADLNESEPASVQVNVVPDPRIQGYVKALSDSGLTDEFVGESMALRRVQAQLAEVARIDLTVLILGETGTGKGLAARTLHALSEWQDGPFIQVNCGALPDALVESELFGHERGAFTSAVSRKLGKAELAQGGSLFLDEIGDMPLAAQVKLLRLLEERTFERVGGTETLASDARLVAATNRDLGQMVADGTFREDLYYRLQVFPVQLPPLRERREDIELLAVYFAERMGTHLQKEISAIAPQAISVLQTRAWPGNIRELAHMVQRAVIVCGTTTLTVEDLGLETEDDRSGPLAEMMSPEEYERRYLEKLLEQTGGIIKGPKGAAARLGVAPSTLRSRLKKLGVARPAGGPAK